MKKIFAILIYSFILLTLISCSSGNTLVQKKDNELTSKAETEFKYVQQALLQQINSEDELIKKFEEALLQRSGALARVYLSDDIKNKILPVNGIGMSNRRLKGFEKISKENRNKSKTIFKIKYIMDSGESSIIEINVSKQKKSNNLKPEYIITEITGKIPSYVE